MSVNIEILYPRVHLSRQNPLYTIGFSSFSCISVITIFIIIIVNTFSIIFR